MSNESGHMRNRYAGNVATSESGNEHLNCRSVSICEIFSNAFFF